VVQLHPHSQRDRPRIECDWVRWEEYLDTGVSLDHTPPPIIPKRSGNFALKNLTLEGSHSKWCAYPALVYPNNSLVYRKRAGQGITPAIICDCSHSALILTDSSRMSVFKPWAFWVWRKRGGVAGPTLAVSFPPATLTITPPPPSPPPHTSWTHTHQQPVLSTLGTGVFFDHTPSSIIPKRSVNLAF
jgi:hypothetical protein